jgi:hypothetical protein
MGQSDLSKSADNFQASERGIWRLAQLAVEECRKSRSRLKGIRGSDGRLHLGVSPCRSVAVVPEGEAGLATLILMEAD